jgi:hypothetical protein
MELKEISITSIKDMFTNFSKHISNVSDPTKTDVLMTDIVIKAINNESSSLIVLPHYQNTRYIKSISENDKGEVYITIEFGIISIVNGSYSYIRNLPEKCLKEIITAFNQRLEKDVDGWKNNIEQKNNNNLTAILNKIK